MSFFQKIPTLPDDPIFRLPLLFSKETNPNKVNLGIGIYQDENGIPLVFSSVRKAEARLIEEKLGKNYLPIDGDSNFIQHTLSLMFGPSCQALKGKRVLGLQTVGGIGALRLGADLLCQWVGTPIYLSDPTWVNHRNIFSRAGMVVDRYPYLQDKEYALDFAGMCQTIAQLAPRSIILLQASCHNPTGVDPSFEQWRELSSLVKRKNLLPFFDMAYQGFGENLEADAAAIRLFAEEGHEMFVAYSYSKNMGIYGERVGALAVVGQTAEVLFPVASQARHIVRGMYSTPPLQGERIVNRIFQEEELKKEWIAQLDQMRERLKTCRLEFARLLEEKMQRSFHSLKEQKGMFSYCGLNAAQVEALIGKHAIYMTGDGRINIAGLNAKNLPYVAESIWAVMQQ